MTNKIAPIRLQEVANHLLEDPDAIERGHAALRQAIFDTTGIPQDANDWRHEFRIALEAALNPQSIESTNTNQ